MFTEVLLSALSVLAQPISIAFLVTGVTLGLFVGVLPGFGGTVGLAVLLPFVYGMDPSHGILLLIGVMSVVATSDTFPAVLMGIPGSVSSQATVMDGFPLARHGQASRALSAGFMSSMIGGVFGAVILTFAVFMARPVVLAFGTAEMLMLILFGITLVGSLTERSPFKGVAAAALGLLLGAIGTAPATAEYRMVFGEAYLARGLPLTVVALAMFAIPEIIDLMRRDSAISDRPALGSGWIQGVRDTLRNKWLVLRCSGMGVLIGMLPGLGGSVVDWIAYGHAAQTCKEPKKFGDGDIRGVIAPESANNAKEGGALIPTLIFAIPGSGVTAIFLGGLVLMGFEPGLTMATTELDTIYLIVWALAVANVVGALACIALATPISALTRINFNILAPFILTLIFFSAFQASRNFYDFFALVTLGVLAVFMRRFGYSRPALMIGFVLADGLETNLYQTVGFYGWDMFTRPLVWVIAICATLSAWAAIKLAKSQAGAKVTFQATAAQSALPALFIIVSAGAIWLNWSLNFQGMIFPVSVSIVLLVLSIICLVQTRTGGSGVFDLDAVEGKASELRSSVSQLGWPVGFIVSIFLLGFLPAAALLVVTYLKARAGLSWLWCLIGGGAAVVLLLTMAKLLRLSYPVGFLSF